ncbi:LysE family translocator [Pseudomonas sp. SZMC_28357]|uniref:LysE family translocator n=1 Tax=Pseudomonas sp. SZMC_28357 TaxID=3074380 RepID=UPI002870BFFC|nr:LysE family translocator [Pseudomonas sp. SZMC_28357]MDR9750242.1 LysE family translocator [Pseudomonas sp. SZMC_28357]
MSLTDYLLFALIAVVQVGSPGPSTIFLINNALVYGPGRALWILTGDLVAIAVLATCSLLGIDALLMDNPRVFTLVKFAGAVYLLWLGFQQLLQARSRRVNDAQPVPREATLVLWGKSFMVGISNPKAILFFSSLLPQFIGNPQDAHLGSLLSLILLFVLIKLLVSSGYAVSAKTMARRLARPGAAVWGKRATGGVLMVFGLVMGFNAFE